jgi:hypothetical protein
LGVHALRELVAARIESGLSWSPPVLFLALAFAAAQPPVPPSEAPRSVTAARLAAGETIQVDGRLDEDAWGRARGAGGFRQREPQEGAAASEDTEVRVLFDEGTLYVGVRALDREPDKVIARILQRDKVMESHGFDGGISFSGDDAVAILIDPFHDRRNAFVFATNPNGAEFDALVTDEGAAMNADWRGVFRVAAVRDSQGWSAEFAIPFRSLRYPRNGGREPWGFNVSRVIRRKNEETLWSSWQREGGGFHRVSRAGVIEGLTDLPHAGLNLEVRPYLLGGGTWERPEAGGATAASGRWSAGLDGKWEVRPGLVLDATVKPDFAQVEADEEQVNLTRFDLYFPEKRDFFLENAGVFEFGTRGLGEPPPFLLFFSRRVGYADDGEVGVLGGVRLSGRVGSQTVGFLDVVTDRAFGEGRTNFGLLRVKRDVGGNGYLGAILADRRSGTISNSAAGVDASLWPTAGLNLQGFFARTTASGPGGEGDAWRLAADYSGDRFGFVAQHLSIDPDATAEMGFVPRTDISRSDLFGRVTLRPARLGLRKIDLFAGGQYISRVTGEKQDWGVGPFLMAEWESGEGLGGFYNHGFTRLDEGFDLSDRLPVPPGDYDVRAAGFFANSSSNRPLSASAQGQWLEVFGGRIRSLGGVVSLRTGSHLALSLGYTRNRAEMPSGSLDADLGTLRLAWAFSTRLVVNAFVQYNRVERQVLANLRLGFIHHPGSDLYLVVNEERGGDDSLWRFARRGLAVKLTYLARF